MRSYLYICLITLYCACSSSQHKHPHIIIETSAGDIEAELYTDQAPISANAFLSYVDSGYYHNASFYRVLNRDNQPSDAPKSDIVQGGIWKSNYKKYTTIPVIPHEPTSKTHLKHINGTLSLARTEPGTASSEFFICIGDQQGYDYGGANNPDGQGYAAFGKVINGMDIVQKIYNRPDTDQYIDNPVAIYDIKRN